jgi:hypothetical protein
MRLVIAPRGFVLPKRPADFLQICPLNRFFARVQFLNILGRKAGHETALAAAAELTPPFLVLSEPANLSQSPAPKNLLTFPKR